MRQVVTIRRYVSKDDFISTDDSLSLLCTIPSLCNLIFCDHTIWIIISTNFQSMKFHDCPLIFHNLGDFSKFHYYSLNK